MKSIGITMDFYLLRIYCIMRDKYICKINNIFTSM